MKTLFCQIIVVCGALLSFILLGGLLVYLTNAYQQGRFSVTEILMLGIGCVYIGSTLVFISEKKDQLFGEFQFTDNNHPKRRPHLHWLRSNRAN